MQVIGLTGGVGSGKSTITHILQEQYGAHIIECDALGHQVLMPEGEAYHPVRRLLGDTILDADGRIDRAKVAGIVFQDEKLLQEMNAIIHPAVIHEVERQIKEKEQEGKCAYVVMETALMIEAGLGRCCDQIWYVYAEEEIRKARLMASRGYTEERIRAVMDRQKSEAEFRSIADVVIDNSGEEAETEQQIKEALSTEKNEGSRRRQV